MLDPFPRLMAQADIVRRWAYTREGIRLLMRSQDFPPPIATVNNGRTRLWLMSDIEAFEQIRPWLLDLNRQPRR